jgi:hypothetical protein
MELVGQNICPTTFTPHVWHLRGKLGVNLPHLPHHPNRPHLIPFPIILHCISSLFVLATRNGRVEERHELDHKGHVHKGHVTRSRWQARLAKVTTVALWQGIASSKAEWRMRWSGHHDRASTGRGDQPWENNKKVYWHAIYKWGSCASPSTSSPQPT